MYATIKDLENSSLIQWDGVNNSFYQTSNRLLKAYHSKGQNSLLNSVTIKQALKYDSRLFNDMIVKGVTFIYQYQLIGLKQYKRYIKVTITNMKTDVIAKVNLTENSAKRLISQYDLNKDVSDVFNALIDTLI